MKDEFKFDYKTPLRNAEGMSNGGIHDQMSMYYLSRVPKRYIPIKPPSNTSKNGGYNK